MKSKPTVDELPQPTLRRTIEMRQAFEVAQRNNAYSCALHLNESMLAKITDKELPIVRKPRITLVIEFDSEVKMHTFVLGEKIRQGQVMAIKTGDALKF